jgi:peptidoglycan glycosyltransferase
LDIRLSIDMNLQQIADEMLGDRAGAVILLNAGNGEILSLASHPTFDPNQLDEKWSDLVNDAQTPLLNRAIQGQYQPGTALGSFLLAALTGEGGISQLLETDYSENLLADENCAIVPNDTDWANVIAAGCELPQIIINEELGDDAVLNLFEDLGFFTTPDIGQIDQEGSVLPIIQSPRDIISGTSDFRVSPLQMALAAATFSTGGIRPIPHLASAINLPENGWTVFPPSGEPHQVFSKPNADGIASALAQSTLPIWQTVATTLNEPEQTITWYMAGTLPTWTGAPLSLVVILEEDSPEAALAIGKAMLESALRVE